MYVILVVLHCDSNTILKVLIIIDSLLFIQIKSTIVMLIIQLYIKCDIRKIHYIQIMLIITYFFEIQSMDVNGSLK